MVSPAKFLIPLILLLSSRVATTTQRPDSLDALLLDVAPIVVSIDIERVEDFDAPTRSKRLQLGGLPEEERKDLEDYFRRPPGLVSGVLLDGDGHVLTTNYNLGKKAGKITVRLPGGPELAAKLLSRDPVDDLALLKVIDGLPQDHRVTPLRWVEGEKICAGSFVLALGRSPDPSRITTTLGVISSPFRNSKRLFQTDAALNYGNVGGPLVDLEGRLVGIAAYVGHKYPQWGFNSGIGFGVRADRILDVLPVMKRGENIPAPIVPFLGVQAADDPDDPDRVGARIQAVVPGSSAAAGGIRRGDVIVEWDGATVWDFMHLRFLIFKKPPGAAVVVKIKRSESLLEVQLTLGKRQLEVK